MADRYRPKLANPSLLSKIEPDLLVGLFKPNSAWLRDQGIRLRRASDLNVETLDRLSLLLMAGAGLPAGLPETLSLIDEMSAPALHDKLHKRAAKARIALPNRLSSVDLAVRLFIKAPHVLRDLRVEVVSLRPRKISRYMAMSDRIPKTPRDLKRRVAALEDALRSDFAQRNRGTGTRVHAFREQGGFRLMIRRGDILRSHAVIDEGDETRRLILRPELYDVVRYDSRQGDLLVNAKAISDAQSYCRIIGHNVFRSDLLFDPIVPPPRYTLEPIREHGRALFSCAEFEGIEEVRLSVLDLEHPSLNHVKTRLGPHDAFAALQMVGGEIDPTALLQRARIDFRLTGEDRERPVFILPPITAIYEHDELSEAIEEFIEARRLLLSRAESLDAVSESLFTINRDVLQPRSAAG